MPRLTEGQISVNKGRYYRVTMGRNLKNGKFQPASFSLGTDYTAAKIRRDVMEEVWRWPGKDGQWHEDQLFWTPAMLKRVEMFISQRFQLSGIMHRMADEREASAAKLRTSAESLVGGTSDGATAVLERTETHETPTPAPSTLVAALDAYAAKVETDAGSADYRHRLGASVAALKYYLANNLHLDAVELAAVDRGTLEKMTSFVKSRPTSRTTGKPISVFTVKTLLQHWRQAFDWLDSHADSDRFGRWEAPRRWRELFEPELSKIRTKAERDAAADGPVQITMDEFAAVYRAAKNDLHRATLLMGVFTAQGQLELAVSRRDEINLSTATYTHRRNKTGQPGTYWLPPQLVDAIKAHWKNHESELAFVTQDGQPLVHGGTDSVGLMWSDLRDRAKEAGTTLRDGITFYSLRRYFGHRAKMAGGTDLRNAALSHSGKEVGDVHYSNHRDYNAVEQVGRTIHAEMVAAGVFEAAKKDGGKKEKGTQKKK